MFTKRPWRSVEDIKSAKTPTLLDAVRSKNVTVVKKFVKTATPRQLEMLLFDIVIDGTAEMLATACDAIDAASGTNDTGGGGTNSVITQDIIEVLLITRQHKSLEVLGQRGYLRRDDVKQAQELVREVCHNLEIVQRYVT